VDIRAEPDITHFKYILKTYFLRLESELKHIRRADADAADSVSIGTAALGGGGPLTNYR